MISLRKKARTTTNNLKLNGWIKVRKFTNTSVRWYRENRNLILLQKHENN